MASKLMSLQSITLKGVVMSDEISAKALKELQLFLESKAYNEIRKQDYARGWRGEITANWLDNFMNRMYKTEVSKATHLINAKTGKPHTVDSLVAELQDRVGLSLLTKEGNDDIPLSKKMAEQASANSMQEIKKAIGNFLSSHRGHADSQAILYYLRDTFGEDTINKFEDNIVQEIDKMRGEYQEPVLMDRSLDDAVLGQPLKLDDQDLDKDQMFANIEDGLGQSK